MDELTQHIGVPLTVASLKVLMQDRNEGKYSQLRGRILHYIIHYEWKKKWP